jgi:hypothetical protein
MADFKILDTLHSVRDSAAGVLGGNFGTTGTTLMQFPSDLGEANRPYIRFKCESYEADKSLKIINLPCPAGISFSDGGSYTTVDVGTIATLLPAVMSAGANPMEMAKALGRAAQNEAKGLGAMGATILLARMVGQDQVATGIEFANKSVRNPRTNAAFSGNTLRNYQFNFKLIGRNSGEVRTIDNIQNTFREQVYAEKLNGSSSFMLKYPNQWTVQFIDPSSPGTEMEYMPKIYTCYLTTFNTVINSTANAFREDSSPYEVDISLQFQETKILTRDEIIKLEKNGDRTNAADDAAAELFGNVDKMGEKAVSSLNKLLDKKMLDLKNHLKVDELTEDGSPSPTPPIPPTATPTVPADTIPGIPQGDEIPWFRDSDYTNPVRGPLL